MSDLELPRWFEKILHEKIRFVPFQAQLPYMGGFRDAYEVIAEHRRSQLAPLPAAQLAKAVDPKIREAQEYEKEIVRLKNIISANSSLMLRKDDLIDDRNAEIKRLMSLLRMKQPLKEDCVLKDISFPTKKTTTLGRRMFYMKPLMKRIERHHRKTIVRFISGYAEAAIAHDLGLSIEQVKQDISRVAEYLRLGVDSYEEIRAALQLELARNQEEEIKK